MTERSMVTTTLGPSLRGANGTSENVLMHPESSENVRMHVFEIVCLSVISLVGIIANIVIIRKMMQRNRKSSEYFILNLAMTDFVVCALCIPLDIYDGLQSTWHYGAFLCKIIWPFQTLFTLVSILNLTAMAIERHRAIMYPFKPRLTRSDLLKAIACVWLFGLCVIAPYINYLTFDGEHCDENWPHEKGGAYYTLALLIIDYCIPLSIITYCYGRAGYKLYVNTREFKAVNAGLTNHAQRTRLERNTRIIKIFSFAVLVFLICMLPSDIYWMWKGFGSGSKFKFEKNFQTLSNTMVYSNSCFNPFIFGACNFGCLKGKFPWSSQRKFKLERFVSANSTVSNGYSARKSPMPVTHARTTETEIDFSEVYKLRETDI